jgi:hypothetical protein
MPQLAIRCHPCVPVSADELEPWLEQQLAALRADAPHGTLRLSRLTQGAPDLDLEIGWLIEFDVPEDDPLLSGRRLADAVRDMRLLGLQPTLLTPQEWALVPMAPAPSRDDHASYEHSRSSL